MRSHCCQNERTRAFAQRLHVPLSQRLGREFHDVALVQEFSQQPLMPGKRGVGTSEQIAQKFLGGPARRGHVESLLNVLANDIGRRSGELPRARRLHERADIFQALQRQFVRQQNPYRAIAPAPPQSIDAQSDERRSRR